MSRAKVDLCPVHYAVVEEARTVMSSTEVAALLAIALGIPLGGLDEVIILRAEGPPRYEGGFRRWVPLRFCALCGAWQGEGSPEDSL